MHKKARTEQISLCDKNIEQRGKKMLGSLLALKFSTNICSKMFTLYCYLNVSAVWIFRGGYLTDIYW